MAGWACMFLCGFAFIINAFILSFIADGSVTMMTTVEMGRMSAIVVSTTILFI